MVAVTTWGAWTKDIDGTQTESDMNKQNQDGDTNRIELYKRGECSDWQSQHNGIRPPLRHTVHLLTCDMVDTLSEECLGLWHVLHHTCCGGEGDRIVALNESATTSPFRWCCCVSSTCYGCV